jgi:dihydrofolate reductase
MRTIRIIEHISLDGVIQAPGGPDEDRDGGFAYGGWSFPYTDPLVGDFIAGVHAEPFDLLLGRRTYDIWSAYWPTAKPSPIGDAINAATKYVATHRPETLDWGPSRGLGTDLAGGVRRMKASDGPNVLMWGSSTLPGVLLKQGLVDEVVLIVYPVLLGTGKRLFPEGADPRELALTTTRAAPSGVILSTYKPVGPVRTGSFAKPGG